MQCPYCGHEYFGEETYCGNCGALLLPEEESGEGPGAVPVEGEPDRTVLQDPDVQAALAKGADPNYVPGFDTIVMQVQNAGDARQAAAQAARTEQMDVPAQPAAPSEPEPLGGDIQPPQGVIPPRSAYGPGSGHGYDHRPMERPVDDPDSAGIIPLIAGVFLGLMAIVLFLFVFRSCPAQRAQDQSRREEEAATREAVTEEAAPEEEEEEFEVEAKAEINDYTWEELAHIASYIEEAPNEDEATRIAIQYNLLNPDGSVTGNAKEVVLSDGTVFYVRVAGILHDTKADGSGRAGITFVSTGVVGRHNMNAQNTNQGGWADSDMRAWMNARSGLLGSLPQELQDVIVPVQKATNNEGHSLSMDCVTRTDDQLFLLSVHEVAGDVNWAWSSDSANSGTYNQIMNAEGDQYQLFQEMRVNGADPNWQLVMSDSAGNSSTWWLRSSSVSVTDHFRYANYDGDPSYFGDAVDSMGVVFGFCL